ncbi:hypothetical protein A2533_03345 [Candidatus Falkowbacteria bacterium RIFOXYD2_FULL_35_9]|uniref:Baseplate protein J-like domain-containing protein n=1 Tax=Candidatus Falkowbacteria bacterium RIFOXYC2_FULL_36_12 TaxID=1798002 RepID=A0A1F5SW27_9BACT|nr:MAG: hypothetical protein A2478_00625 [Candidatus Falkowbacteria bacterium RIFOXYC2_FULL_36_12]OGF31405.1 MAG: hypothetical protein A2300_01110 [Candidatus Falkowbacteria bacterium RIFOXYB2_FULL_35_7]OGF33008.1 MAG: hypothetical protein A2223_02120 [Candidatus Falkowbacteria bacterium RIFOXYA2_FULL_35_8]OGF47350.1 MAG: hypothetical protein A2533_03345 [Candidatus Falkowbacteria bacterium RIFOXYD2_FULL_35_9]
MRGEKVGVSKNYVKFIAIFVILSIALIFVIFYFTFSKALIQITPKKGLATTDFIAGIETQSDKVTGESLNGFVFETEVEKEMEFEATGSKSVDGDILGQVMIYNKLTRSQPLVATTRLLSVDGVLLRLKNRVDVPAGGSISAEVYADNPADFESLAPTKFTIPGLSESLQVEVYAESNSTLKSGGSSIKIVKASDIARAKEDLTNKLYEDAVEKFKNEVGKDHIAVLVSKKIIEETISAGADDVVDTFKVKQKMSATLIGIAQDEILTIAATRLRTQLSPESELGRMKIENLTYVVQNYNAEEKTASIKIHAEAETVLREDSEILNKDKIVGLSDKGVELYLSSFDEIENVQVKLSPFWVRSVPSIIDNITIEVLID